MGRLRAKMGLAFGALGAFAAAALIRPAVSLRPLSEEPLVDAARQVPGGFDEWQSFLSRYYPAKSCRLGTQTGISLAQRDAILRSGPLSLRGFRDALIRAGRPASSLRLTSDYLTSDLFQFFCVELPKTGFLDRAPALSLKPHAVPSARRRPTLDFPVSACGAPANGETVRSAVGKMMDALSNDPDVKKMRAKLQSIERCESAPLK